MSEPAIVLRDYRVEDEDGVVALWWDSWHSIRADLTHPLPRDAWRARWVNEIVPAQRVLVAETAGQIAGFVALSLERRELTQLFVAPSRKRSGIGLRLLSWAKATAPSGFVLSTWVENAASRAFYLGQGLVEGEQRVSAINGHPIVEFRWTP